MKCVMELVMREKESAVSANITYGLRIKTGI